MFLKKKVKTINYKKIRESKKPKRIFKKIAIGISAMSVLAVLSLVFILYQDMSKKYPDSDIISSGKIVILTKYSALDSPSISKIKASARTQYITTGSSVLVRKLDSVYKDIDKLSIGDLDSTTSDKIIKDLQVEFSLKLDDVNSLYDSYKQARLNFLSNQLSTNLDNLTPKTVISTQKIALELSKISEDTLKKYLSSSQNIYPVSLDNSINVLTRYNTTLNNFKEFTNLFTNYNSLKSVNDIKLSDSNLEKYFNGQVSVLQTYTKNRLEIESTTNELKKFKTLVVDAKKYENNYMELPNYINMSVKDAKVAAAKSGLLLSFTSDSDTSDTAIILDQSPNNSQYPYIKKGMTIKLLTTLKVETKPNDSKQVTSSEDTNSKTTDNTSNSSSKSTSGGNSITSTTDSSTTTTDKQPIN